MRERDLDLVLSGGMNRTIPFLAFVDAMEDKGYTFSRVSGCSAGALIAVLRVCLGLDSQTMIGYAAEFLCRGVSVDVKCLVDDAALEPAEARLEPLIRKMFGEALFRYLAARGKVGADATRPEDWGASGPLPEDIDFRSFSALTGKWISVAGTDVATGRKFAMDPVATPGVPVIRAMLASTSIPLVFPPVRIDHEGPGGEPLTTYVCDGCISDNTPWRDLAAVPNAGRRAGLVLYPVQAPGAQAKPPGKGVLPAKPTVSGVFGVCLRALMPAMSAQEGDPEEAGGEYPRGPRMPRDYRRVVFPDEGGAVTSITRSFLVGVSRQELDKAYLVGLDVGYVWADRLARGEEGPPPAEGGPAQPSS